MKSPFYVTTPIYYINDVPHLGTAYTTIAADVLARYARLRGADTWFLTGTDEHGIKVQRVAEQKGMAPQAYADEVSAMFRGTWPRLGCAPDDFIRTSEARHKRGVQELWRKIQANGDLYLGHYEGLYCVGCEAYYTEKDLEQPGNLCPIHGTAAETVKEESYFFKLSRYADRLLDFYAKNPSFVQPPGRMNEVKSFVTAGLSDLSVSRTTFQWGIPVPDDPRHVMYVWFDALSNYLTAVSEPPERRRFWPASVHLVGKDILRFHAIFWPAFLMAAGYGDDALPRQVFAHGFLTYGGQKMSKSLRNTISPAALAEALSPTVGVDTVRYCLMRAISFGQDGDFSIDDVLSRYGSELGNSLGNLLNRVQPFAKSVPAKGATGPLEAELAAAHAEGAKAAAEAFDAYNPTRALDAIWTIVAAANVYVDKAAPWAAKKQGDDARLGTIVATLVEELEALSVMVAPVMPAVADAMRAQLGLEPLGGAIGRDEWPLSLPRRAVGDALPGGAPIFPRLEKEKEQELRAAFAPAVEMGGPRAPQTPRDASRGGVAAPVPAPALAASASDAKPAIAYDDFAKLELKVGVVLSAERVKKKDKLLDLRVDAGEAEPRRIVAGIATSYAPEALVGKRVVLLANLPPREFGKGLVSQGMLLAAEDAAGLRVVTVDGEAGPGSKVR
jgi:methionyl-tRNA synthetase